MPETANTPRLLISGSTRIVTAHIVTVTLNTDHTDIAAAEFSGPFLEVEVVTGQTWQLPIEELDPEQADVLADKFDDWFTCRPSSSGEPWFVVDDEIKSLLGTGEEEAQ